MRRAITLALTFALAPAAACGDDSPGVAPTDAAPPARNWPTASDPGPVPAYEQRPGDPAAGYTALVNNGIVRCGLPYSAYARVLGDAPESQRLPGRTGHNATLPYYYTASTAASGVEVVSPNCLTCHAERLDGELVIGLGNTTESYTGDAAGQAILALAFVSDPTERDELNKLIDRLATVSPYTQLSTRGVNPADNLAAILFAHRDPTTLAWSFDPLMEPPPALGIPVDVPPWWRMRDKNAMFYVGAGRGDHARHMMAASSLCTDTVEEAADIDRFMPDVAAYVRSLEPPAYPGPVDADLAAQGRQVYASTCAECHGTYGAGAHYPNLITALDDVGTDPTLALGAAFFAGRFVDWYNASFFGELGYLAPATGYYAPSLRGIWATAPFFHNGSVPDLYQVLSSTTRPAYWSRSYAGWDYDLARLGWRYTALDHGKAGEPDADAKIVIYDTTGLGYGNGGHTFGDDLDDDERWAVIEYMKTL